MTYFMEKLSRLEDTHTLFSTPRLIILISTLLLATLVLTDQAYAQRIQPMSYELGPSGSTASTSLRIENNSKVDMTLELMATKISVDGKGTETNVPAEDDFLIFPPQLILKAGKTQAIRVKYIGEPTIDESVPYRISVKQIPIDLSGSGRSGVGMVVNFHTLAHVTPKAAKVDLHVSQLTSAGTGNWKIAIDNRGKKMARLSQTIWTLTDGGQSKTLSLKEVADLTPKNLVMPNKTLTMTIPAVEGFNPGTTTVKISAKS